MGSPSDSLGPGVDVALLADAVQAVRGKLFILGGGWDTLWVQRFPARHPSLAIGLRLRVPVSWASDSLKISDLESVGLWKGVSLRGSASL